MDTLRRKSEKKNVTECYLYKLITFEQHIELQLSENQRAYKKNYLLMATSQNYEITLKVFEKQIQSQVKSTWMIKKLHQILIKPICLKNTFSQFLTTPSM